MAEPFSSYGNYIQIAYKLVLDRVGVVQPTGRVGHVDENSLHCPELCEWNGQLLAKLACRKESR